MKTATVLPIILLLACSAGTQKSETESNAPDYSTNEKEKTHNEEYLRVRDELMEFIKSVDIEDPQGDAELAYKAGNKRFFAVEGFLLELPGLPSDIGEKYMMTHEYQIIRGTSDAVYNEEHINLLLTVTQYSRIYNQTMHNLIQSNSVPAGT